MEKMKSFKDLNVWQESVNLAEAIYVLTKKFPKEELYALVSQIRRSVVSVPANIAEGYGRKNRAEYLNFLSIAYGSLTELETHLIISQRLGYVNAQELETAQKQMETIGRMLTALRKSLSSAGLYPKP